MYQKITILLNEANINDKVKCVLLTGNGSNFCSGNDLTNFMLFPMDLMN